MRKFLITILILAMAFCCALGFVACDRSPVPDENQGQTEQDKDTDGGKEETPGEDEKKPGENEEQKQPEEGEQKPDDEEQKQPEEGEQKPDDEEQKQPDEGEQKPDDEEQKQPEEGEQKPDDEEQKQPDEGEQKPDDEEQKQPDEGEQKPDDEEQKQPDEGDDSEDQPGGDDPEPHVHQWVPGEAHGTDPNNTVHVLTCECGAVKSENCTWTDGDPVAVAPTCTEDGYKIYTCTVCGNTLKTFYYGKELAEKSAKGHNWTEWEHIDGTNQHQKTCQNEGCNEKVTENCRITETTTPATCENAGSVVKKCQDCENQTTETLNALGHDMSEWQHMIVNGQEQHEKHCKRPDCNEKETGVCSFKVTEEVKGDCQTDGKKVSECDVCHYQKVEITPASGQKHDFSESNICSKCGTNGLKFETVKIGGFQTVYAVVKNEELKDVKKLIIQFPEDQTFCGISENAFSDFTNLEVIFISKDARVIADSAFTGAGSTEEGEKVQLYYDGTEQEWSYIFANGLLYGTVTLPDNFEKTCEKTLENFKEDFLKSAESGQPALLPASENKRSA